MSLLAHYLFMQCRGESVHVAIDNVLQTTTDNPTRTVISNHDHVFNLRTLYGIAYLHYYSSNVRK